MTLYCTYIYTLIYVHTHTHRVGVTQALRTESVTKRFPAATVANLKPALWFCGIRCKDQISAMVKYLSGVQCASIERNKATRRDGYLKKLWIEEGEFHSRGQKKTWQLNNVQDEQNRSCCCTTATNVSPAVFALSDRDILTDPYCLIVTRKVFLHCKIIYEMF